MLALLEIDEYFVDEFSLEVNPVCAFKEEYDSDFDVDFSIARSSDGKPKFEVKLFLEVNKKDEIFSKAPYRIDLQVTGYFHFDEGTDENKIKTMITPNGLAILYGIARNLVSQMTGVGRYGRFLLPSVNFIEIIKDKAKRQEQESQA